MVNWFLGTISFSYKDWEGVFYPAGTASRQYLAHYSQIFNSVELDSTFYGTPPGDHVHHWAAATPPDFKFCVKTPRQITHDLRLVDALEPMQEFLETMSLFGEKLGAVLIQLPPSLSIAEIDTFNTFISQLPVSYRYAIEFRHSSWFNEETARMLETHRICWVSTEYVETPKEITPTTDFLYVRWLGRHGRFKQHKHVQMEVTPQLDWWSAQLRPHLDWMQTIYGYFNNDYSGFSPKTCNQFKEMMDLPVQVPQIPQQGRLF